MPEIASPGWIWGAAAVLCYAAMLWVHPWRKGFGEGWRFARCWQRTWLVLGMIAAHQVWWQVRHEPVDFAWPQHFAPPFAHELIVPAAVAAANSLARTLVAPLAPEPFSALLALALAVNWSGFAGAVWRGCRVAFPRGGKWAALLLFASAAANVASVACEVGGWAADGAWRLALHTAGALWSGATVAFALAWILRFAETAIFAPEEILMIQWSGSAAGRIARLWPILLGAAVCEVLEPLLAGCDSWRLWTLRTLAWVLALLAAFLPLVLVHWRGEWGWLAALREARLRFMGGTVRLAAWALVAFTQFFLFHLARSGIAAGFPARSVWRLGWESLAGFLHSAILIWLAASWVAQQQPFFRTKPPQKNSG